MKKRTAFRLSVTTLLALSATPLVWADVAPVGSIELLERYKSRPNAYDRVDTWCNEKNIGSACQITGNAFEGGGEGSCKREMNIPGKTIDLTCRLTRRARIERSYPKGAWQIGQHLCQESRGINLDGEPLSCTTPPLLPDRFCKDLQEGAACKAEVSIGTEKRLFDGICKRMEDKKRFYYQGRHIVTRPVLNCEPAKPTPPSAMTPISTWKKLLQW